MAELPEHVRRNRAEWTEWAPDYAETAPAQWQTAELTWGVWGVPEAELRVLPERLEGLDTVELGCGTAYVSAWLARQGARPVGVDVTPAQLATARGDAGGAAAALRGRARVPRQRDARAALRSRGGGGAARQGAAAAVLRAAPPRVGRTRARSSRCGRRPRASRIATRVSPIVTGRGAGRPSRIWCAHRR